MPLDISCAFPPGPDTVAHARLAESLGYRRVWCFDSSALYGDVWVQLALVAQATERVEIGPAVLVPSFRHPLTQAAAIAQLASLAPGRVVVAIGTGFTGRMALGQRPLAWKQVRGYVDAVQRLLAGEQVEVDGRLVELIAPAGLLPARPVRVPWVIAANGPLGLEVARELGDGVMTVAFPQPEWPWCATLTFGTVLDDGEALDSPRVLAAAGPAVAAAFHAMYEDDPAQVDGLPGGPDWRGAIESVPEPVRHLAVHEDHLWRVTERDAPVVTGELVGAFTWTAPAPEIAARLAGFQAAGGTEIVYAPMGPDVARELRAFAAAAGLGP